MIQTIKPLMLECYGFDGEGTGHYVTADKVYDLKLCRDGAYTYGEVIYQNHDGRSSYADITKESAKALLTDSLPIPKCLDVNA